MTQPSTTVPAAKGLRVTLGAGSRAMLLRGRTVGIAEEQFRGANKTVCKQGLVGDAGELAAG